MKRSPSKFFRINRPSLQRLGAYWSPSVLLWGLVGVLLAGCSLPPQPTTGWEATPPRQPSPTHPVIATLLGQAPYHPGPQTPAPAAPTLNSSASLPPAPLLVTVTRSEMPESPKGPATPVAVQPMHGQAGATPSQRIEAVAGFDLVRPYLEGVSSWYGPTFHGKPTASGEIYNQYALTAAHPVLPMGTRIMVENLSNGRRVWVRINDRGPYARNRILDLSQTAAAQLDMIEHGTAPVRITILEWPDTLDTQLGLRAYFQYVVQVASYPLEQAQAYLAEVQGRYNGCRFALDRPVGERYPVFCGPFNSEAEARQTQQALQRLGVGSFVRTYRK